MQHLTACKRKRLMQLAGPMPEVRITARYWTGLVIDTAPADPKNNGLSADAEFGHQIDHFLALASRPALAPRAPDKNRSQPAPLRSWHTGSSHRSQVRDQLWALAQKPRSRLSATDHANCLIWLGCTSKSCANSIKVFSPLIAATATLALNTGLWLGSGRFVVVFSSLFASCRRCAENPLIQTIQFSRACSAFNTNVTRR